MAYTDVWSNSAPAGSAAASTIDDEIRKLRLGIDERMDDLVNDWSADDPIVDLTISRRIHWTAGSAVKNLGATYYTGNPDSGLAVYPSAASTDMVWYLPIPMDQFVGATLTRVDAKVYRDGASDLAEFKLFKVTDGDTTTTPTIAQVGATQTQSSTGWDSLSVSSLTETLSTEVMYHAVIRLNANSDALDTRFVSIKFYITKSFGLQGIID